MGLETKNKLLKPEAYQVVDKSGIYQSNLASYTVLTRPMEKHVIFPFFLLLIMRHNDYLIVGLLK